MLELVVTVAMLAALAAVIVLAYRGPGHRVEKTEIVSVFVRVVDVPYGSPFRRPNTSARSGMGIRKQ